MAEVEFTVKGVIKPTLSIWGADLVFVDPIKSDESGTRYRAVSPAPFRIEVETPDGVERYTATQFDDVVPSRLTPLD